ncbi:MAG: MinD/ParA family protein [Paenisporosarcina sp.]
MRDQAESLRMHMLRSQGKIGRSIAVVSGKGGVGKSNFSINFSSMLSSMGKKVVLVDMDIGMGNIHILLGKSVPTSLKDYLVDQQPLESVMYEGPNGMIYISGGSGLNGVLEWTEDMFSRLIQAFEHLQKEFDVILFDMGAGATNQTLDLIGAVDDVIVISTAEPTAITDAYSMMKYIHFKDPHKNFYVVCNRAFTPDEGRDTVTRLSFAMLKFLDKEVTVLGSLPEDPVVRKAVKEQVPFSILYPDAEISKTLHMMTLRFTEFSNEEVHATERSNTFISRLKNMFSIGRD